MSQPIKYRYDPRNVDVRKCNHDVDPPVCWCIHDWRIGKWGNTERKQ